MTETNDSGRGRRDLRIKVKTAKGRKLSSTLWLERQLNDPYVAVPRVNALGEKANKPIGTVLGVDLQEIEPIAGCELHQLDFLAEDADGLVKGWLGGKADVVLSDMAASASGHKGTDHLRIIALVEAALAFAFDVLEEDGTFVAKVLAGGAEVTMQNQLKKAFRKVANVKPPASRADSSEKFVVAQGFRGLKMTQDDDPRDY